MRSSPSATPRRAVRSRRSHCLALPGPLASGISTCPCPHGEWLDLRRMIYEPYNGALNNRAGATGQQTEAEARLIDAQLPAIDLYFGRAPGEATGGRRS